MAAVILIAEDEPQNRKLFRDILNRFGYQTLEALNGRQAVEMAREEKPGLILMDIHMPVMDGWAAIKAIREDEATREIPALALTAYIVQGESGELTGAGFNDYITKPISIKGFLAKVAEFLPPGG